jgi:hypothetical protein
MHRIWIFVCKSFCFLHIFVDTRLISLLKSLKESIVTSTYSINLMIVFQIIVLWTFLLNYLQNTKSVLFRWLVVSSRESKLVAMLKCFVPSDSKQWFCYEMLPFEAAVKRGNQSKTWVETLNTRIRELICASCQGLYSHSLTADRRERPSSVHENRGHTSAWRVVVWFSSIWERTLVASWYGNDSNAKYPELFFRQCTLFQWNKHRDKSSGKQNVNVEFWCSERCITYMGKCRNFITGNDIINFSHFMGLL